MGNIGFGIQRIIDAQQRFIRNVRQPVYMRVRNFTEPQNALWAQLGYRLTPASGPTGTTDMLIDPPPMTRLESMHNIGMSNGKLRFGARSFVISQTFVSAVQSALELSAPEQVWIGQQVVGLVGYNVLWSIESYTPEDLGGETILWTLICNANELK